MTKHTPGPWHRNIKPVSSYPVVFAGRNTHVATISTKGLADIEAEANCNLIAAAPIMSDTLKRAAHILAELPDQSPELIALRSQIVECIKQATPEYYGSKPCS